MSAAGVILARMGKASRAAEPSAQQERAAPPRLAHYRRDRRAGADEVVTSCGLIRERWPSGWAPAGPEGIRPLKAVLAHSLDQLIVVPLPDYPGSTT